MYNGWSTFPDFTAHEVDQRLRKLCQRKRTEAS
jgi:hypothetical protein